MAKVLLLDNYDSFTYNLAHLLTMLGVSDLDVRRNDQLSLDEIDRYESIVLSPGPGLPQTAGIMPALVREYASRKKILGVCLGHQCIAEIFGASLTNLTVPTHGKSLAIEVLDKTEPAFAGLPQTFNVGRYHSWVVSRRQFPETLAITAEDSVGNIMAIRHREFKLTGVQFHPESILTEYGSMILKNWLDN